MLSPKEHKIWDTPSHDCDEGFAAQAGLILVIELTHVRFSCMLGEFIE
jgi:hypothetical protein